MVSYTVNSNKEEIAQLGDFLKYTDHLRLQASRNINAKRKFTLRQYFSTSRLATLMASMLNFRGKHIHILDPGAGIGSLFAACIGEIIRKRVQPEIISVTAYEVDDSLGGYIQKTFNKCSKICNTASIVFQGELIRDDFIQDSAKRIGLFSLNQSRFNYAIINPPYGKIHVSSLHHKTLKAINSDATNYYSAFISTAARLLNSGGEMVSITPRSFCNGALFKQFRKQFLSCMDIKRIHIFKSRNASFVTVGVGLPTTYGLELGVKY